MWVRPRFKKNEVVEWVFQASLFFWRLILHFSTPLASGAQNWTPLYLLVCMWLHPKAHILYLLHFHGLEGHEWYILENTFRIPTCEKRQHFNCHGNVRSSWSFRQLCYFLEGKIIPWEMLSKFWESDCGRVSVRLSRELLGFWTVHFLLQRKTATEAKEEWKACMQELVLVFSLTREERKMFCCS